MTQDQREMPLPGSSAADGLSWSWHLDFEALLTALSESPCAEPPCTDAPCAEPPCAEAADSVEADFADYMEARDAGRTTVVPLSAAAGRVAEILPTSPDLAGWLAGSTAEELEDRALAGTAAAYRRLAAWAQAGELAAVAQMASRSAAADEKNGVDEDGRPRQISADACGQVSLALTLSQSGAQWWTNLAVELQWRLAATGLALRNGIIDLARAQAIVEAASVLGDGKARVVEAKVLPRAGEQTIGQLRASLRRAVITADPEGAERRREEAERRAKVILYPDAEGTACLAGQSLPGVRAAAAMARITALARALKAAGVDGGIDLLRSKVFLGLLLGTLPYIPPPPEGPADSDCPPEADGPAGAGPEGGRPRNDGGGSPHLDDWPWSGSGQADGSADGGSLPWPEVTPLLPPGPAVLKNLQPAGSGFLDLRLPWVTLTQGGPEPGYLTRLGPITPAQASDLARLAAADPAVEWRVVITDSSGWAKAVARVRSRGSPAGFTRAGPGKFTRAGPENPSSLVRRVTVIVPADELSAEVRDDQRAGGGQFGDGGRRDGGRRPAEGGLAAVLDAIIGAAGEALARATERALADAEAGGCAHGQASLAYQVPVRLREFVSLRDLTCRFPTCQQPAWRCDADHTRPFDQDGPTCSCNLGSLCRYHHQLKQHPMWRLEQPLPGIFIWTTPTGRTYAVHPDSQVA